MSWLRKLWPWGSTSAAADDGSSSSSEPPSRKRPREDDDDDVETGENGANKRRVEAERVLLSELTCPVCLNGPLLPPVRQCPHGHLLCDACAKMPACAKCPTCRAALARCCKQ